jgi:hypothetical protein
MSSHTNIYVFVSADRRTFGLTLDRDGANLPSAELAGGWKPYDMVPMCMGYLGRYADEPEIAHANLIARGYHLARTIGNIVPFPKTKLCSWQHPRAA